MNRADNTKPIDKKERLKMVIARVGDSGASLFKRDIQKLVSNVTSEDQSLREYIISVFGDCIEHLSLKSSLYATSVGLISTGNQSLSEGIVDLVMNRLQTHLDEGNLLKCDAILQFLGELTNLGYLNSLALIDYLSEILREAEGSINESLDFYLYLAINNLPYTIDTLRLKSALEFKRLVDNIDNLMKKRNTSFLETLRVYSDSAPTDTLSIIWKELQNCIKQNQDIVLRSKNKPDESFIDDLKAIKAIKRAYKLNFNTKKVEKCRYQSEVYLDLIELATSNEENELIDQVLIKKSIYDLLTIYAKPENVARELSKLLIYNNYFNLVIEGIFYSLFQISHEKSNPGVFSTINFWLMNLLKDKSLDQKFKTIMNNFLANLLQKIDVLTYDATRRFIKFYVNFVTINGFEIDWEAWRYILESDKYKKKIYVLNTILSELCSLTFYEKIEEITPIDLRTLLPLKNPASFLYDDPSNVSTTDVDLIKDKIASKLGDFEMLAFLKSEDNGLEASGEPLVEIFLQCFLNRSSKSLTHFDVTLERYKNTLKFLISSDSDEIILLNTLKKFWQKSEFYLTTYFDYFESKEILKSDPLIDWLFAELRNEYEESLYSNFCWDFLLNYPLKLIKIELNNSRGTNSNKKAELELKSKTIHCLATIFKKSLIFFNESIQKNTDFKQNILSKLGSFLRRYIKELKPLLPKLEDDNSKYINQDVSKILSSVKLLV